MNLVFNVADKTIGDLIPHTNNEKFNSFGIFCSSFMEIRETMFQLDVKCKPN